MTRPGLQPQRTSLAWNRTALASLGLLGAVTKVAADNATACTVTCAAIVIVHTLVVAACAVVRGRARRGTTTARVFAVAYVSTAAAGIAAVVSIADSW